MLTSFAFFPGSTKGRLSHSLQETGLPGLCSQGAALLTPNHVGPHRCRRHCCLVTAASQKLLVPTSKMIRKSFLLFLLFPTSSLSLLPSFSPPSSLLSPHFNLLVSLPPMEKTSQPVKPHPPPGPRALSLQPGRAVFIYLRSSACVDCLPEVAHSLSEGM